MVYNENISIALLFTMEKSGPNPTETLLSIHLTNPSTKSLSSRATNLVADLFMGQR